MFCFCQSSKNQLLLHFLAEPILCLIGLNKCSVPFLHEFCRGYEGGGKRSLAPGPNTRPALLSSPEERSSTTSSPRRPQMDTPPPPPPPVQLVSVLCSRRVLFIASAAAVPRRTAAATRPRAGRHPSRRRCRERSRSPHRSLASSAIYSSSGAVGEDMTEAERKSFFNHTSECQPSYEPWSPALAACTQLILNSVDHFIDQIDGSRNWRSSSSWLLSLLTNALYCDLR